MVTFTTEKMGANGQTIKITYNTGTSPQNNIKDSIWQAFGIVSGHLKNIGLPFTIKGEDVGKEMDNALSIHGHEPKDIALRFARRNIVNALDVNQIF